VRVDGLEEPSLSILSPGTGPTLRGRSLPGTVGGGQPSYEESGVLRTERHRGGRHAVALLLCGAVLVTPLLLLRNDPAASAATQGPPTSTASAVRAPAPPARAGHRPGAGVDGRSTGSPGGPVSLDASPVRHDAPATSTTTEPPPTTTTTTAPPPPTTTTRPPPPPTTTTTRPPAVGSGVHTSGIVTYYAHPAGRCASPWLPFGTVVTVTNPANGATVTCTVDDREADTARSIDLATASFAVIAPLWQGVVDARLSW